MRISTSMKAKQSNKLYIYIYYNVFLFLIAVIVLSHCYSICCYSYSGTILYSVCDEMLEKRFQYSHKSDLKLLYTILEIFNQMYGDVVGTSGWAHKLLPHPRFIWWKSLSEFINNIGLNIWTFMKYIKKSLPDKQLPVRLWPQNSRHRTMIWYEHE